MRRTGRKAPVEPNPNPQTQSEYFRAMSKRERLAAAKHGWINWYINRGIIPRNFTKKDLRALSWRRRH